MQSLWFVSKESQADERNVASRPTDRNAAFWLAFSPGALALIVAYGLLLLFPGLEPIALIPFLAAGWLCSIAFSRSRGKRESGGMPKGGPR